MACLILLTLHVMKRRNSSLWSLKKHAPLRLWLAHIVTVDVCLLTWLWQKSRSIWEKESGGIKEREKKLPHKIKYCSKRMEGQLHQLKQNMSDKKKWVWKKELVKNWSKCGRGGLNEKEQGGVHHSVAKTGWYLHLPVICTIFCRVEEKGKRRRRCKRGEEERENLYPLYLWASSPAVQEPAFQECLIFKSLISAPVLSIAVLYFYMSFACSSSNLAPSIFFFFFLLLLGGVRRYEHACTRE